MPLNERELAVAALLAQGLPNKAIASKLFVSVSRVKEHVGLIMLKLGVDNRTQIALKLAGLPVAAPSRV